VPVVGYCLGFLDVVNESAWSVADVVAAGLDNAKVLVSSAELAELRRGASGTIEKETGNTVDQKIPR
jgi:hypothetical protein